MEEKMKSELINVETISLVAGILLSLFASYFPGFKTWFGGLEPTYKRLVMLGALLVVSSSVFGISCTGLEPLVTCDVPGVWIMVKIFVMTLVANQAAFLISPKGKDNYKVLTSAVDRISDWGVG
jgi:hypothetical protein